VKYHRTGRAVEPGDLVQVTDRASNFAFLLGRVRKLGIPNERSVIVRFGDGNETTLTVDRLMWIGKPRSK